MWVCVSVYECMPFVYRCLQKPKEGTGPLELELQVFESPEWVLGTELGSSGRAAGAVSH